MWFGILTPGAHPSRRHPTRESTVLCWTAPDRRRIEGPAWAVQGGMRVMRRLLREEGLASAPPRCFVCREPCAVPDAEQALARPTARLPEGSAPPPLDPAARHPAMLAFVHLAELEGSDDPSLEEDALVVVPGQSFAMAMALAFVPEALGALAMLTADDPPPACGACGTLLPGGADQRARAESRAAPRARRRREHRPHGRRAA